MRANVSMVPDLFLNRVLLFGLESLTIWINSGYFPTFLNLHWAHWTLCKQMQWYIWNCNINFLKYNREVFDNSLYECFPKYKIVGCQHLKKNRIGIIRVYCLKYRDCIVLEIFLFGYLHMCVLGYSVKCISYCRSWLKIVEKHWCLDYTDLFGSRILFLSCT